MEKLVKKVFEQAQQGVSESNLEKLRGISRAMNANGDLNSSEKTALRRLLYTKYDLGWDVPKLAKSVAESVVSEILGRVNVFAKKYWEEREFPEFPCYLDFDILCYAGMHDNADLFNAVYQTYKMLYAARKMFYQFGVSSEQAERFAYKKILKPIQKQLGRYWTHETDKFMIKQEIMTY